MKIKLTGQQIKKHFPASPFLGKTIVVDVEDINDIIKATNDAGYPRTYNIIGIDDTEEWNINKLHKEVNRYRRLYNLNKIQFKDFVLFCYCNQKCL